MTAQMTAPGLQQMGRAPLELFPAHVPAPRRVPSAPDGGGRPFSSGNRKARPAPVARFRPGLAQEAARVRDPGRRAAMKPTFQDHEPLPGRASALGSRLSAGQRSANIREKKMTGRTLDAAIALNRAALDAMVKGDCSGYVALLSDRDDVTWGNPFGPFALGRSGVEATLASAASRMRGGSAAAADHVATYVSEDLAVVVDVEHAETMANGADALTPATLRVTSVFRLEDGAWKVVHRHADPITTPR